MRRSLLNALMNFAVCCFSLALLVYVAEGKAGRTYEQFYRDAGMAQAQLVQGSVESFLRQDVPLRQFAGFGALIEPLLAGDSAVSTVLVTNERGELVFSSHDGDAPSGAAAGQADASDTRIVLPLRSKFETVGTLSLQLRLEEVSTRVVESFRPLWILVAVASVLFTLLTLVTQAASREKHPWTAAAFAATFVGVAAVVTVTLIGLYADGASAKGRALLSSLGGRLDDVTGYGLNFDQIDGLDRVFAEYRRLNSDISAVALVIDGVASVHTDAGRVGVPWSAPPGSFDYAVDIGKAGNPRSVQVAMAMPKELVHRQIADSLRNMLALFVASAFFAHFFMNLARSVQGAQGRSARDRADGAVPAPGSAPGSFPGASPGASNLGSATALGLVKPVFFLATFVEHLNYAFLPQYVQGVVQASGVSGGWTSAPFIAYYLCFAAALVPAGRAEQRHGPHRLIWAGLLLAACGLLGLALQPGGAAGFAPGFAFVVAARALSGIGQGMLFIGVQSYILRAAGNEARTRGAAVIVIGFQAGMISGMAIGSLLVSQLGPVGVFQLGAATAAAVAFYAWAVVPRLRVDAAQRGAVQEAAWRNIASTLRDLQFLRAITLIGLPAKAVLTGVILFALPLMLSKQGFGQEDIGQITMVYAACVIAASAWASRWADRSHATGGILAWGAVLSGFGVLLVSSLGWKTGALEVGQVLPATVPIVLGVVAVGVAHGFINAPIVTHVTDAPVSTRLGAGSVAATYRLLERAGHTAGPVIVGQVVAQAGSSMVALGWIGGALIVLGLLFALSGVGKADGLEPKTA